MALTVSPAPSVVTAQPSTSVTTVGKPITLTATINVPPGTGTPTGTVTFLDGTTVLGTAPVYPVGSVGPTVSSPTGGVQTFAAIESAGESGQATLTVASLPAGENTITAVYSGDATHSPSTTAIAQIVIVAPSPDSQQGPTVVSLARYGYHEQRTYLVIYFDGSLDPSSAQRASNYKVVGPLKRPGSHKVVTSAKYDAANDTVTLAFNRRFNLHDHYRLIVKGTGPSGITGSSNIPLNATAATEPGRNGVVRFGPKILAGPANLRTSFGHSWFNFHHNDATTRSHVAVRHRQS